MNILKKLFPLIYLLIIIPLLIVFRSVPSGHLWDGYSVLYIPDTVEDSVVVKALEECEIKDYVGLNQQRVPVLLDSDSPEISMLKINLSRSDFSYLYDRNNFFYDSTLSYRIYYIPSEYKKNLEQAVRQLDYYGVKAGTDASASYPWIVPVLVIAVAVILFVFSKNKLVFLLSSFIYIIYALCNPFYAAGVAVFLVLLCLFFISNLWNRKNFFKLLLKKHLFLIILLLSFFSAFSSKIISGIFFTACVLASALILYVLYNKNSIISQKYPSYFEPVMIRPARLVSVYAGKGRLITGLLALSVALMLASFFLFSKASFGGHFAKVLLPGEAESQSEKLPELEDYFNWVWNVKTYPFRSLNTAAATDRVTYPRYVEGEDGLIQREDYTLYFDDEFRQTVSLDIDSFDFNSIEGVLKAQPEDFKADYTAITANNVTIFSIIMMIICFILLLFIYFSAMIRKGGKRR